MNERNCALLAGLLLLLSCLPSGQAEGLGRQLKQTEADPDFVGQNIQLSCFNAAYDAWDAASSASFEVSSSNGQNASTSVAIALAATTAAYTARCASNLAITAATVGYCGLAYTTAAAANAAASAASAAAYGRASAAEVATSSALDLALILSNETYGLAQDCRGFRDSSYNVTVAAASAAAASASVATYFIAYMSTSATSNITRTFRNQALNATEYAINTSTAARSASKSQVVSSCIDAVTYATAALQQTTTVSIYDLVSSSFYYVAKAVTSAASSVGLIQTSTVFISYSRTIQLIYSEQIKYIETTTDPVPSPLVADVTAVAPAAAISAPNPTPSAGGQCPAGVAAGNQTLQLSNCPVEVYCTDNGTAYLNLRNVGDDGSRINYSQYGPSPNNLPTPATTPTTVYSKVRFDLASLSIVINDYTFATMVPAGATFRQAFVSKYSNFSTAGDCKAPMSSGGQANINLLGTNLAVEPDQFSPQGYEPAGRVTYVSNNQVVVLTGGGFCGAEQPLDDSQFVKLSVSCQRP